MRILIIEDDRMAAKLFGSWLEKAGYEVETAFDGTKGLDRIAASRPDGVLLDLLLPGANGWEVLKILRSTADFSALPVLVYTNGYVKEMVDQAIAAGATQVLNKATITSQQLKNAFNALLGNPGASSDHREAA